jgi:DNA (cytosine-5)-methyltransferase 1
MNNQSALEVQYIDKKDHVIRQTNYFSNSYEAPVINCATTNTSPDIKWMLSYLKGKTQFAKPASTIKKFGLIDLFSGCGGFTLGAKLAAYGLGVEIEPLLAVDIDPIALDVYSHNLKPESVLCKSVSSLVNYQLWSENGKTTFSQVPKLSPQLLSFIGRVSIVIGGPPCQGHSGFNNHTRSKDDRNLLYLDVPAIGIALDADLIVIENVYNILKDKFKVVDHATNILENHGYVVTGAKLIASDYGVAQSRMRHFLIASKHSSAKVNGAFDAFKLPKITVGDVIEDLVGIDIQSAFDTPSKLSDENVKRIRHLFENDSYKLPNYIRPDCHKNGHTYPSVYGRLNACGIANTITTGFASPGRGRYIHPSQERALTAHEAARLQGFPDSFRFTNSLGHDLNNTAYGKLIGDAVPPPLGSVPIAAALLTDPIFKNGL